MKRLRHLALSLLLVLSLATTAFATEVPESLVVENLNGQQRIVKTYVLSPETDPEVLKEPSFDYDGFTYTWAYTTKDEHTFLETKNVTETVTVETGKKDLNAVLEQLTPSISYDDGEFSGELALDHTTIVTEAAGYTTKSGKVTATKTIGPLDRNDMSYVPATTVKDGRTLSLVNVDWQVIGTDLVGEVLAPSSYQAVATYSASTSYQVATGYVSSAEYKGTVTASGIESITYTVVYVGTEIVPETSQPTEQPVGERDGLFSATNATATGGTLLLLLLLAALVGGSVYLFLHRKNVYIYVPGDQPRDYKLIAKFRVEAPRPEVDITGLEPYPESIIAVEIKRPLAKKLLGQTFTVHHRASSHAYTVLQDRPGDWHEFDPSEEKEELI
ncbi:hypothetical protein [uncultured Oscillibacter sp.]|uniref:hypothetical protein n=1 Tax=uncultured Oscillibacter sp. TaxID=876091 RepID=UPI0026360708|nr:hypothetical protein [uncultured Oscillibacter sp.]